MPDIIERYERLVAEENWPEALELILQIIDRGPQISTSWFNYGVCLDALERHDRAAGAFQRAMDLAPPPEPDEPSPIAYAAQFRMCRSLMLAGMLEALYGVFAASCADDPAMIATIRGEPFSQLFEQQPFAGLISRYADD